MPAFSKAAKKLDGIAKVGVVNCDVEQSLAQKYGVSGFPSIKVFKGEGKKARRPSDYNGERTSSALVDHAKYVMPNFIARVKESGIDAFFTDERSLPHVLLFTDKKSTSPLYKGMAAEFRNRIAFGEVRKPEIGDLKSRYEIKSFPMLLAFSPGDSSLEKAVVYTGSYKPSSLRKYFDGLLSGEPPVDSSETDSQKPDDPVFKQPKAFKADVATIASGDEYMSECGLRKDGRMCGLAFLPGGISHKLANELKAIAEKYQYDNLAFAVVDISNFEDGGAKLAKAFGIQDGGKGGFVTIRGKKKKFALHDPEAELTTNAISGFLDRLVGGDARFKKVPGDLPLWGTPTTSDVGKSRTNRKPTDSSGEERPQSDEDSGTCGLNPPKDGESCSSV